MSNKYELFTVPELARFCLAKDNRIKELEADYGRLQNDNQKYIDNRIAAEAKLDAVRGIESEGHFIDGFLSHNCVPEDELLKALDNS